MAQDFQVIAQRQSSAVDDAGGLRDVVVITFRTTSGAIGTIRVPLEGYTVETVAQLIGQQAAQMEAVAAL